MVAGTVQTSQKSSNECVESTFWHFTVVTLLVYKGNIENSTAFQNKAIRQLQSTLAVYKITNSHSVIFLWTKKQFIQFWIVNLNAEHFSLAFFSTTVSDYTIAHPKILAIDSLVFSRKLIVTFCLAKFAIRRISQRVVKTFEWTLFIKHTFDGQMCDDNVDTTILTTILFVCFIW